MEFDIKKYLELKKEFTYLLEFEIYNLKSWNKTKKSSELLELSKIIYDNVQWPDRYQYYEIVNNFVENKSTIGTLFSDLSFLAKKNSKRSQQLENNLNSETISFFTNESSGFSSLISHMQDLTNLFEAGISDSESSPYGISENVLKEYLKKQILSELQKYCKK